MSSPTTSPFLDLPAELRNMIYEYVLSGEILVQGGLRKRNIARRLALLQVNRQLHDETQLIPFSTMTLVFKSVYRLKSVLERVLPDQRHAVSRIQLRTFQGKSAICDMSVLGERSFEPLALVPNLMAVEIKDSWIYHNKYERDQAPLEVRMKPLVQWVRAWRPDVEVVVTESDASLGRNRV